MDSVFELDIVVMSPDAHSYPIRVWRAEKRLYATLEDAEYAINVRVLEEQYKLMVDEQRLYCFFVYEYPLDEDIRYAKELSAITIRSYLADGKPWKQSIGDLLHGEHDNPFTGRPAQECSFDVGDVCEVYNRHMGEVVPAIVEARPLTPKELSELSRNQEVEYTDAYFTLGVKRSDDASSKYFSVYLFPPRFEIPQQDQEVLKENLERYEEVLDGVVDVMCGLPEGISNPRIFGGSMEALEGYLYVPGKWCGCDYALLLDASANYIKDMHPLWCYVVYPHCNETLLVPLTIGHNPKVLCVDGDYASVAEAIEKNYDFDLFISCNMNIIIQLADECINEDVFMWMVSGADKSQQAIEE